MLGVVRVIVCAGFILLVAGCGEDTRYSGNTQYLGGGVYGGGPAGQPRDTVSYWDGDSVGGSPSVRLAWENSAPIFIRAACSSVFRNYPPDARDSIHLLAILRLFKKTKITPPACSEIM